MVLRLREELGLVGRKRRGRGRQIELCAQVPELALGRQPALDARRRGRQQEVLGEAILMVADRDRGGVVDREQDGAVQL